MDSNAKQLPRLQQLLLKTLRPNLSNQSDSAISESAPNSTTLAAELSPEYTTVYSGFFLDGILTIAVRPEVPFVFEFALELLDSVIRGQCEVPESAINVMPRAFLVDNILESVTNVYTTKLAEEGERETKH